MLAHFELSKVVDAGSSSSDPLQKRKKLRKSRSARLRRTRADSEVHAKTLSEQISMFFKSIKDTALRRRRAKEKAVEKRSRRASLQRTMMRSRTGTAAAELAEGVLQESAAKAESNEVHKSRVNPLDLSRNLSTSAFFPTPPACWLLVCVSVRRGIDLWHVIH